MDFVGRIDLAVFDFGHDRTKGLEVVDQGLIDQDVAVHQEKHPADRFGFPEPPNDLEGGVGLAGAGSHDQQHTALASGHSFDHPVDGLDLIVPRFLSRDIRVKGLDDQRLGRFADAAITFVALPNCRRRRELA